MSKARTRERSSTRWIQRGGVSPERVERVFGDDFDEVLPAEERKLRAGERVIELSFGD